MENEVKETHDIQVKKEFYQSSIEDTNNENELDLSKKHECEFCGKGFKFLHQLKLHRRVHTGERPYSCEVCQKPFKERKDVKKHMRTHTREDLYECKWCGKKFCYNSNLIKHKRIHTGDKPHSCTVCGKSFSQKNSMIAHLRIHTGERPYSCDVCGKRFAQLGNLSIHIKKNQGKSECGRRRHTPATKTLFTFIDCDIEDYSDEIAYQTRMKALSRMPLECYNMKGERIKCEVKQEKTNCTKEDHFTESDHQQGSLVY